MAYNLQNDEVDLNGVILLSQILNFDLSIDTPESNPGTEEPYPVLFARAGMKGWREWHKPLI